MQLYPAIEFMRQGKHQMVIGDRQYILLLALCPLSGGSLLTLGAMAISAAVIQGSLSITVVTLIL